MLFDGLKEKSLLFQILIKTKDSINLTFTWFKTWDMSLIPVFPTVGKERNKLSLTRTCDQERQCHRFRKDNVIGLHSPFPSTLLLKDSQSCHYDLGKWTLINDLDQKKISNTFSNPQVLKLIILNFSTGDQNPPFSLQSYLEADQTAYLQH